MAGFPSQVPKPEPPGNAGLGERPHPPALTNRCILLDLARGCQPAELPDSTQCSSTGGHLAPPTRSPTPDLTAISSIPAQHPVQGGNSHTDNGMANLGLCCVSLWINEWETGLGVGEPVVTF